jgi:hypothetical protein
MSSGDTLSPLFELWRQDDNGHRFLVGTYGQQSMAEQHLAELTRVVHKQIYWISERYISGGTDGKN